MLFFSLQYKSYYIAVLHNCETDQKITQSLISNAQIFNSSHDKQGYGVTISRYPMRALNDIFKACFYNLLSITPAPHDF